VGKRAKSEQENKQKSIVADHWGCGGWPPVARWNIVGGRKGGRGGKGRRQTSMIRKKKPTGVLRHARNLGRRVDTSLKVVLVREKANVVRSSQRLEDMGRSNHTSLG